MTTIRPIKNKLAVIPILETVTDWGFQMADHSHDPAIHQSVPVLHGSIFAIDENLIEKYNVDIGDTIMFFNHNRNKVEMDDVEIIIMPIDDVIGVYE